ncbi:hypothetical protein RR42_m0081 [Cupriavidus basilensis]|uniref:Uncharacterized protein n=1 Tax=Cupriavidus basilensis TaxID=68895 RepID=A0A0C4YAG6_9BURK|nr:hypothetical protein RR42_m0081 [Cupriavidus basilensis]
MNGSCRRRLRNFSSDGLLSRLLMTDSPASSGHSLAPVAPITARPAGVQAFPAKLHGYEDRITGR